MKHYRVYIVFLLIGMIINFQGFGQTHRIRIQIQGDDIKTDISAHLDKNEMCTKLEALELLDGLWDKLSPTQKAERQDAYYRARDYIKNSPANGRSDQGSHSFQNANRRIANSRVDIEINRGGAFSDERHIVYIRVIGADLSANKSWSYDEKHMVTKKEALAALVKLWNSLSATQKDVRESAYRDATNYISRAEVNGREGNNSVKEFKDSKAKKGEKIVITIDKGAAFSD